MFRLIKRPFIPLMDLLKEFERFKPFSLNLLIKLVKLDFSFLSVLNFLILWVFSMIFLCFSRIMDILSFLFLYGPYSFDLMYFLEINTEVSPMLNFLIRKFNILFINPVVDFYYSYGYVFNPFSFLLTWLTFIIFFLCVLYIRYTTIGNRDFYFFNALTLLLTISILMVFLSDDLLVFYFFFELTLLPMFIMIGYFGSRERRSHAAYSLFLYTLVSSLVLLYAIGFLYYNYCTLNLTCLKMFCDISEADKRWLWICFFIGFAAKIPCFPFHVWLPEAHTEAPTVGSVFLAALLLKLGILGFTKVLLPLTGLVSAAIFQNLVLTLCFLGTIYCSAAAITQVDFKRIVAYSSVVHMALALACLSIVNIIGNQAAMMISIAHGFISAGMFFICGFIYDRTGTRNLSYIGNFRLVGPVFATLALIHFLGNMGVPGTFGFVGELYGYLAISYLSIFALIIFLLSVFLSAAFSIRLYSRVFFGRLVRGNIIYWAFEMDAAPGIHFKFLQNINQLNLVEETILFFLSFFILFFGFYPFILTNLFF